MFHSSGTEIIVGTHTLTPGSPPITINGLPISRGHSNLVVGSSTNPLQAFSPIPTAIFALGNSVLTPNPLGLTIGSAVLTIGGPALVGPTVLTIGGPVLTVSGRTISLGTSGVVIEESGSIKTVPNSQGLGAGGAVLMNELNTAGVSSRRPGKSNGSAASLIGELPTIQLSATGTGTIKTQNGSSGAIAKAFSLEFATGLFLLGCSIVLLT